MPISCISGIYSTLITSIDVEFYGLSPVNAFYSSASVVFYTSALSL